jgi:methylphosphotriester-DNA--protein-cysteine methyltransferase
MTGYQPGADCAGFRASSSCPRARTSIETRSAWHRRVASFLDQDGENKKVSSSFRAFALGWHLANERLKATQAVKTRPLHWLRKVRAMQVENLLISRRLALVASTAVIASYALPAATDPVQLKPWSSVTGGVWASLR